MNGETEKRFTIDISGTPLSVVARYDELTGEWRAAYCDCEGRGATADEAVFALAEDMFYAAGTECLA